MAGREEGVADSIFESDSPVGFSGFESEHSVKEEEIADADDKSELSEFIRNLPGLPANNNSVTHSTNDVLTCVTISCAASGPLEDQSDIKVLDDSVPVQKSDENVSVGTSDVHSNLQSSATEHKSRDRRSRHKSRECRKCYERRKVKRSNVGVQCRIERQSTKNSNHHYSLSRPLNSSSCTPNWEIHKYAALMSVEVFPNGNASVVHMHQDEIDCLNLNEREARELAEEFFRVSYLIS